MLNSVAHRLIPFRPRSRLASYDPAFRTSIFIDAVMRWPDCWLREDNMVIAYVSRRPDFKKRDSLWNYLLGQNQGC